MNAPMSTTHFLLNRPRENTPRRPHKSFSHQVKGWIDPNKHFSKVDILRTGQTKPAGDALESTPLQPTDQRYQLYKLRWNISNCDVIRLSPPFFHFSDHLATSKSRSRNYKLNKSNQFIDIKILLVSMMSYLYFKKTCFCNN